MSLTLAIVLAVFTFFTVIFPHLKISHKLPRWVSHFSLMLAPLMYLLMAKCWLTAAYYILGSYMFFSCLRNYNAEKDAIEKEELLRRANEFWKNRLPTTNPEE
jgi:hypothetical protein